MSRSYAAFISYKHARRDSAIAKEVHTLIENYVIPKALRTGSRKLGVVFRDEEELPISSDLTDSIQTALRASQYLILICSPEASQSPWVSREVDYFLQTHDASRVFVVLAAGEPGDVFPSSVTRVLNPQTGEYQDVEPLALDVRADSIPASLKKLRERIRKLYAAMLGCSYDSLVQREKVRRMKRIMALSALLVLVATCFAGVILFKNMELSEKNAELYEATQSALRRESLLLAANADAALQNNDTAAAIGYAADALDSSVIERPYCAAAERALYSALNIFGDDDSPLLLSRTALAQQSPIVSAVYSSDGRLVFTIDSYGIVICFDAATGAQQWSRQLPENNKAISTVEPTLWYDTTNDYLLCSFDGNLSAHRPATGETVWLCESAAKLFQGPFYDSARQTLLFLEAVPVYDDSGLEIATEIQAVSLQTPDGSRRHEIHLFTNAGDEYIDVYNTVFSRAGGFTNSGRFVGMLACCCGSEWKSLLYRIDAGAGEAILIENETYASLLDIYHRPTLFFPQEDQVILLRTGGELRLRCLNTVSGSLLWEVSTALRENSAYYPDAEPIVLPRTTDILIGYGNAMYLISKADGSLRSSKLTDDCVVGIWPLQPGLFGYALADGYTAVGWVSAGVIRDSQLYGATINLPQMTAVIPHNRGLLHAELQGASVRGVSPVPQAQGGGSMLYMSQDRLTAWIAAVLPTPEIPPYTAIASPDRNAFSFGEYIDGNHAGTVLVGSIFDDTLLVADAASHTLDSIPLQGSLSPSDKHLLTKDGQGVMIVSPYGSIQCIARDGSSTVLSQPEDISLGVLNNVEYTYPRYASAAARQSQSGSILSARCDPEQIVTWLDDHESGVIPIPENVRWSVRQGIMPRRMLHVSPSGLLVLSHYASEEATVLDSFAVYHPARREWKLIPDAARGTANRLIGFSSEHDRFAVYDEDMVIRVYDYAITQPMHCIDTSLAASSVETLGFLPGDEFLYLGTGDGQVILYAAQTGQVVFRVKLGVSTSAADFSLWPDNANSRLYLRVNQTGVCIDTRSWETLYTLDNHVDFLFYSGVTNEVCVAGIINPGEPIQMVFAPAPTTDELVRIAREALN